MMIRRILAGLALVGLLSGAAEAQVSSTRAALENQNNTSIIANGVGAITAPKLNSLLGNMIESTGTQLDQNVFSQSPLVPTLAPGTDTQQAASTAFVINQIVSTGSALVPGSSPISPKVNGGILFDNNGVLGDTTTPNLGKPSAIDLGNATNFPPSGLAPFSAPGVLGATAAGPTTQLSQAQLTGLLTGTLPSGLTIPTPNFIGTMGTTGVFNYTQDVGNVHFEIDKDSAPLNFFTGGTRVGFVVQVQDTGIGSTAGATPLSVFNLNQSGEGTVTARPNSSQTIWEGMLLAGTKTQDGTLQLLTIGGQLGTVGATGYNELSGIDISLSNTGSVNAGMIGVEALVNDGSAGSNGASNISILVSRLALFNAGSTGTNNVESSEGSQPIPTIMNLNPQSTVGWVRGLDLAGVGYAGSGSLFTSGEAIRLPNNIAIASLNAAGNADVLALFVDSGNIINLGEGSPPPTIRLNGSAIITSLITAGVVTTTSGGLIGSEAQISAAQFPALTGDITTPGASLVATLATVNSNVGSFGGASSVPNFTVNAKGLVTAAGSSAVVAPAGTLTGTLATSAEPAHTGAVTNSAGSLAMTITPTITAGGPVGSSTTVPVITFNAAGQLTAVSSATISGGSGTVTSVATTGPITGGTITGTGTIACATCGVTGSPLSQFATTTSAQLAGVLSDETGTGFVVFNNSPTLITPALGTPSALILTNATGLPNAGLVNSSVTIGTTSLALGASQTIFAGLASVTSTTFVGALTGHSSLDLALTGGALTGSVTSTSTLQLGASVATARSEILGVEGDIAGISGGAQLIVYGGTAPTKQLLVGFDTTGNQGFIQATLEGSGSEPLLLQPQGGVANFGGALASTGAAPTCGTGCASVTGSSTKFAVTAGTAVTSITVNFAASYYASAPVCTIGSGSTASVVDVATVTALAITLGASVALTGGVTQVICVQ
jgi:hypothetical protein